VPALPADDPLFLELLHMTALSASSTTPPVSLSAGSTPTIAVSAPVVSGTAVPLSAVSVFVVSAPGTSGEPATTSGTPAALSAGPVDAADAVRPDSNVARPGTGVDAAVPADAPEDDDTDLDDLDADGGGVPPAVSHLQAASMAFDAMAAEPRLAALDCDAITSAHRNGPDLDLPAGKVNLAVLRDWLLANPANFAAKDAVWRALIELARTTGGEWRLAALGMAMPALVRLAGQVSAGYGGDRHDLDADLVVGFLTALDGDVDPARPAPYASLLMAAFRAAHERRASEAGPVSVPDIEAVAAGPRVPCRPYGHPDLLVHRAALLGVIADADAEPFIEVRIAGRAIEPVAERLRVTVDCLRMRLNRAAERLAEALAAGELTALPVPEASRRLAAVRGSRSRTGTAMVVALPSRARRRRRQVTTPGVAAA
jgi:hypothetical protein